MASTAEDTAFWIFLGHLGDGVAIADHDIQVDDGGVVH